MKRKCWDGKCLDQNSLRQPWHEFVWKEIGRSVLQKCFDRTLQKIGSSSSDEDLVPIMISKLKKRRFWVPPLTWNCTTAGFLGCRRDSLYFLICVSFVKRHLVLRDTDNESVAVVDVVVVGDEHDVRTAQPPRTLVAFVASASVWKNRHRSEIKGPFCCILRENTHPFSSAKKFFFFCEFFAPKC